MFSLGRGIPGGTVKVLGQYVLTGPIVAVHLFSTRAPRACTARRPPARCMLAEQMYCYVRDAKSLLGCRSTVILALNLRASMISILVSGCLVTTLSTIVSIFRKIKAA